jgi:hypothetical protein
MINLNEHVNRMKQLFNAEHGIIKPLVKEQEEFDDFISNTSGSKSDITSNNKTTPNTSNSNYKNANDSFEDKDDLINKPGSGKNIVATVNVNIKNNTKKTEEIVKINFTEDQDANKYLGDPNLTADLKDYFKNNYGYELWGFAKKNKYSVGDSIYITATIPLELGNSRTSKTLSNINLATKSNSGKNTTIQIHGSIVKSNDDHIAPIRITYEVNEPSPFGPKKQLTLYIGFLN